MTEEEYNETIEELGEEITRLGNENAAFEKRAIAAEDAIDDIQRLIAKF